MFDIDDVKVEFIFNKLSFDFLLLSFANSSIGKKEGQLVMARKMQLSKLFICALLFPVNVITSAINPPEKVSFEKMRLLLGDWRTEGSSGETFYISFSETAGAWC